MELLWLSYCDNKTTSHTNLSTNLFIDSTILSTIPDNMYKFETILTIKQYDNMTIQYTNLSTILYTILLYQYTILLTNLFKVLSYCHIVRIVSNLYILSGIVNNNVRDWFADGLFVSVRIIIPAAGKLSDNYYALTL